MLFFVITDLQLTIKTTLCPPAVTHDDYLENIEVGSFVAVNISNCDKVPVMYGVLLRTKSSKRIHLM